MTQVLFLELAFFEKGKDTEYFIDTSHILGYTETNLKQGGRKMRITEKNLLDLISHVVFGKKSSIDCLSKDDIFEIYKVSRNHSIFIFLPKLS